MYKGGDGERFIESTFPYRGMNHILGKQAQVYKNAQFDQLPSKH